MWRNIHKKYGRYVGLIGLGFGEVVGSDMPMGRSNLKLSNPGQDDHLSVLEYLSIDGVRIWKNNINYKVVSNMMRIP